jgi:hypothetical protein
MESSRLSPGGTFMRSYRLYCLDSAGKIHFADWIKASTDEEAVAIGREKKSGASKCEVWEGSRLVASLDTQDLAGLSG